MCLDEEKVERLQRWNLTLEAFVAGDTGRAEEEMASLIEDVKSEVGEEKVDGFIEELDKNYRERAEEIDEETDGKTPEDVKRRQMGYRRLDRWRVGELYGFLRDVLRTQNLLPEVEQ